MSTVNTNVADYLTRIELLTKSNLQLLEAFNRSFVTNKEHIFAEVNDTTYVIPSFVSLENKVNLLQENFNNLVNAPESGEAYFNVNGNSRSIEVCKYNNAPAPIALSLVESYGVDNNNMFKDVLTPQPYINFNIPTITNDITEVIVKKIVAKNETLKSLFANRINSAASTLDTSELTTNGISAQAVYGDVNSMLIPYTKDVDYVEYDTTYQLPIKKYGGSGEYIIEKVIKDYVDDNFDNIIVLKIKRDAVNKSNLVYKWLDETLERPLNVNDELVTYNGTGKVVITSVNTKDNELTVKVANGDYLNFVGTSDLPDGKPNELSILRFHTTLDFTTDKYVKVPLENDQYVFIAVAPLNPRMRVQSSWGTGLIINTYGLTNGDSNFKTYYENNVKNLGAALIDMTTMLANPVSTISKDRLNNFIDWKDDAVKSDDFKIMYINGHIEQSEAVKNIRKAYETKCAAEKDLKDAETRVSDINLALQNHSEDSTTKTALQEDLKVAKTDRSDALMRINEAISTISSYNNTNSQLENAKFRVRGFYKIENEEINSHVIGLKVRYRYRHSTSELGNIISSVASLNQDGKTYIFSEWNEITTYKEKIVARETKYDEQGNATTTPILNNGVYKFVYESDNEDKNEWSYNQIDIPITRGEAVDIEFKAIYDFGQPFATITSQWSQGVTVNFTNDLYEDGWPTMSLSSIVKQNSKDVEKYAFRTTLENLGVSDHVSDNITVQNKAFYHQASNIASGIYDGDRMLTLQDVLTTINNDITVLKNNSGDTTNNCKVFLKVGPLSSDGSISGTELSANDDNTINLKSHEELTAASQELSDNTNDYVQTIDDTYVFDTNTGKADVALNLVLYNSGKTPIKLYPLFYGKSNTAINDSTATYVDKKFYSCEYTDKDETKHGGVWFKYYKGMNYREGVGANEVTDVKLQTTNQYITFRINDVWDNTEYYTVDAKPETNNVQSVKGIDNLSVKNSVKNITEMILYPWVSAENYLCIDNIGNRSYLTLAPGESKVIPFHCSYVCKNNKQPSIFKTISFDIRDSLYHDPTNYVFTVVANNTTTKEQQVMDYNEKSIANYTHSQLDTVQNWFV